MGSAQISNTYRLLLSAKANADMTRPLSRRREIEAAIAAHRQRRRRDGAASSAVRLLAVMFPG